MNAVERLQFLIDHEQRSAEKTKAMLAEGKFSPIIANLMEADVRKTEALVKHLELVLAELKG